MIATTSNGDLARDERRFTTDVNQTLMQGVAVMDAVSGDQIEGLTVQASTRLYAWRDRTSSTTSTKSGIASLYLKSLSQAPTIYQIQVPDQVINGIFYSSSEIQELTIEPGTTSLTPLTLKVKSQSGRISGILSSRSSIPLTVWAIQLPGGPALQTQTDPDGLFSFANIPVARYAVFADPEILSKQQMAGNKSIVDLTKSPDGKLTIDLSPTEKMSTGTIEGQNAEWMPFAWLVAPDGTVVSSDIRLGTWSASDRSAETSIWTVIAPGYYSQEFESPGKTATLVLVPRPDLEQIEWGSGNIFIPSETLAKVSPGTIDFDSGRIWGSKSWECAFCDQHR